ncbi:uncharacterized protein LOC129742834 [Uranotaenia lowii]|uniref:uncharacterized protein LOC129742834 n=1 Tax=Uranotaenia lowii TaxID=190385 RepID=UPI002479C01B|nr:uncharacterized protein LOC129742834 [Uranotaenia lowii]
MQSLFEIIPEEIETLAYADDITLIATSPFSRIARRKLQTAVDKIAAWAPTIGFTFAPEKSNLLHFGPHRKRLRKTPLLNLCNKTINLVRASRILGVWVDDQLKFSNHINRVRKTANRKLNILKKLCGRSFSGSRATLFLFVHGWLLPTMLHGIGIFGRGYDYAIRKLAPAYNHAIRMISGAFKSSPIPSLMSESGQVPFEYILLKSLSAKTVRWLSFARDPAVPLIARTEMLLNEIQATIPHISPRNEPRLLKWNRKMPSVDLSLLSKVKAGENPSKVLPLFRHLSREKYGNVPKYYTDGSKTSDQRVGCGIHSENLNVSLSLPTTCSVFSLEAYALLSTAFNYCPPSGSVVFSDSASVLKASFGGNVKHPWIAELSEVAVRKNITLCWVPGHSNIPGNEIADQLANVGTQMDPPNQAVPSPDAIKWLKQKIKLSWSHEWNHIHDNKLREVKNSTDTWNDRKTVSERRILTRLRIGHTRLTHEYLMEKEDPPVCIACKIPLSVKHIILNCPQYHQARVESGLADNLRQVLSNCPTGEKKILTFLQKSKLISRI